MFGLDPDTIRNIKQAVAKIPDIDKVILYGSRAKGNYRNGSDIDITLFGENLTLDNSVYPLMGELEELYLPYMFDISIFSDIDNENLTEHINRVGKVFYRKERGFPKGWEMRKLGEVCEVIAGQSPEGKYYNSEKNGLSFYQGKKEFTKKYIGEPVKWTTKVTKEAEANDILMSVRAPVGPVNFATQKICIGRGLAAIRAKELIDKEFLFNFLVKHENEIVGNTGAVFNSINKKQIEYIEIPLPPLPEQKRIVVILDKAFTAIAKAKANTEQNLKNAREIFQSALQTEFANGKLKIKNGEWEEKKLGEVCEVIAGQSPEGKYYNSEKNGLSFYQGKKEFTKKYIGEPVKWTTKVTKEAEANDILMSVRAPVGPVNFATQKICIGRGLAAIRAKELIDKEFLFNFLVKHENEIVGNTGAVFNSINKKQIEYIEIPLPPLPEQKRIAKKLDALSTETKKLETIYQQKINDLDELKKSILQKAFSGEL